jgi:hypothetical protein
MGKSVNLLYMVMFNSYVKLPEGSCDMFGFFQRFLYVKEDF